MQPYSAELREQHATLRCRKGIYIALSIALILVLAPAVLLLWDSLDDGAWLGVVLGGAALILSLVAAAFALDLEMMAIRREISEERSRRGHC